MKKILLLLTLLTTLIFAESITFKKGWNFVGFNNTITPSTDTTFNNKDNIYVIWKYTNNSLMPQNGWSGYSADSGMIEIGGSTYTEITSILPSDGVWIYAKKDFSYTLPTTSSTLTSLPINGGWNLLSALDNNTLDPAGFTNTQIIWTFRTGVWLKKSFIDNDYSAYSQLTTINANEAFWLYSTPETDETQSNTTSTSSSLVRIDTLAVNSTQCSTGGVAIYTGIDANSNNILDASEQGTPQIICNGVDGATGETGTEGTNGTSAVNSLVRIDTIDINSTQCLTGGTAIYTGLDANSNNILDTSEQGTPQIICNGTDGVDGTTTTDTVALVNPIVFVPTGSLSGSINSGGLGRVLARTTATSRSLWLSSNSVASMIPNMPSIDGNNSVRSPFVTRKVEIDSYGKYSVQNLPTGAYSLSYADPTGTNKGVKFDDIVIPSGQDIVKNVEETDVKPLGSVSMNIASLTGDVLSGAEIRINDLNITELSDSNGSLEFTGLPEGSYSITVTKDNYVSKYMTFNVISSQNTDLQTIELNSVKGELSGQITAEHLEDYSNILVYAKAADGSVYTTITDSSGNYLFPALPVDSGYSVLAYAHDYQMAKINNIDINSTITTQAESIELTPYPSVDNEVSVGSISGFARFSDKDGLNHAGIIVAVEGTDYEAITSNDGSFILNNIPSGRYTLNILDSNYETQTFQSQKIIDGTTKELTDITLNRIKGTISGIVSLNGFVNSSNIKVALKGTDYSTYTDANGQWSMQVPIGNYSDGVEYSKSYFTTIEDINTATITYGGIYEMATKELTQSSANIDLVVSIPTVSDLTQTSLQIIGTSSEILGTDITIQALADGYFSKDLALGEYKGILSYSDGLHEIIEFNFSITTDAVSFDLGEYILNQSYFYINNKALYTNDTNTTLNIGHPLATQMRIREATTDITVPYANSYNLTLSSSDGTKTVTIDFIDNNDAVLSSASDTIILDTTVNLTALTLTGASTAGDTLHIKLTANEVDGSAVVSIDGISDNIILYDNGVNGDATANDGNYETDVLISTVLELNLSATASFTDAATNTAELNSTSADLVLSTSPTIYDFVTSSDMANGSLTITFKTDEPTTTKIQYGTVSFTNLDANVTVSASASQNHSITLTGLAADDTVYLEINATDGTNETIKAYQSKLSPPSPEGIAITAGNAEIGLGWLKNRYYDIQGYNVYRSSDGGVSYIKANTSLLSDAYYLDNAVSNSTTYYYKVTAVDENGNESLRSDPYSATPLSTLSGPTTLASTVISSNQVWLSSLSPYNIEGNIKVDLNGIMYILPGTTLDLIGSSREILLEGKMFIYGSADNYANLTAQSNDTEISRVSSTKQELLAKYVNWDKVSLTVDYEDASLCEVQDINLTTDELMSFQCQKINRLDDIGATYESSISYKFTLANDVNIQNSSSIDSYSLKNSNIILKNYNSKTINYIEDSNITSIYDSSSKPTLYYRYIKNSTLDNVELDGYFISHSILKKVDMLEVEKIYMSNISLDSKKLDDSAWNGDLSSNYWNTTNVSDIITMLKVEEDQKPLSLYPIISSADMYNADFDGDGIPDYKDYDQDDDGIPDTQEFREIDWTYSINYSSLDASSKPNSTADSDGDGISDSTDSDIDGDGISNSDEESYGTDIYLVDSDGDLSSDKVEIDNSYDPLNINNHPLSISIDEDINELNTKYLNSENKIIVNYLSGTGYTLSSRLIGSRISNVTIQNISTNVHYTYLSQIDLSTFNFGGELFFYNSVIDSSSIFMNYDYSYKYIKTYFSTIKYSDMVSISDQHLESSYIYKTYLSTAGSDLYTNDSIIEYSYSTHYGGGAGAEWYYSKIASYQGTNATNRYGKLYYCVAKIKGAVEVHNSILNYYSPNANVYSSDMYIYDDYATFFNDSYMASYTDNTQVYSGLGSPTDTIGDESAGTSFTLDGSSYTVDGIYNPRITPHFPGGESDLWNPVGVGQLWDLNNPTVIPVP